MHYGWRINSYYLLANYIIGLSFYFRCKTLESHLMQMVCLKLDSSLCPAETIRFKQTGHQADRLDLCPSLDVPAKQNKLSHNCLFQELCESMCF